MHTNKTPCLYLDIDGVLLQKDGLPASGLDEFLSFVIPYFECYWLTTHCKGDKNTALQYLKDKVPETVIPSLGFIQPTNWQTWKTEAIDFQRDFLWLDDYVFAAEQQALIKNNALQKLRIINLISNPNPLLDTLEELKRY